MGRTRELVLDLRRASPAEQWGFSLVGGSDVRAPLIVTRVSYGSPVEGVLQRGDIITKVGNYDARDIRHQDAQNLFKNSGSNIRVVVQREATPRHPTSTGSSRASYSPLSLSPHLSPRGGAGGGGGGPAPPFGGAAYGTSAGSALTPVYGAPLTPLDNNYFEVYERGPGGRRHDADRDGDVHVTKQPYRTTPLVLPGAKVKRDQPTESYLRHHPNPEFRAPPHHLDSDLLVRKKVANSVLERISTGDPNKQLTHKQFNSPINLYSESNVVDTIHKQTGINAQIQSQPVKRHVKFNPAESETYKALQEEQLGEQVQEVAAPPQSRIYAPTKKQGYQVNQNPGYVISHDPEVIQQSGSFKRLMWSVLPGSNF